MTKAPVIDQIDKFILKKDKKVPDKILVGQGPPSPLDLPVFLVIYETFLEQ